MVRKSKREGERKGEGREGGREGRGRAMVKRTDTRQQETDRPLAIRPAKLQLLQEILHLCACVRVHIYTYILHTHTHTHTHTQEDTHTHTHTHTQKHACTHAYTERGERKGEEERARRVSQSPPGVRAPDLGLRR